MNLPKYDDDVSRNFETLWGHTVCGFCIVDAETREILAVNPVAARMFGDDPEKILGKRCHKLICPAEADSCPIMDKGLSVDHSERVFIRADGQSVPIIKTVAKITYNGRLALLESFTEITKQKDAETKLRLRSIHEQESLKSILNGVDALITVCDLDTNEILFLNDGIRKYFGIEGDGIGEVCYKLLQGLDKPCDSCLHLELRAHPDKPVVWEHHEAKKGGILHKMARLIDWPGGKKAHLEYALDITELRKMEKSISHLEVEADKIFYDPLTGIRSRRFFEESIGSLLGALSRSGGELGLMLVDIDFFKQYNDTYGHVKGDECLKAVAETLQGCMMRKGDFVARYGGEEFVIVLPNAAEAGARMIARKLLDGVRNLNIPHAASSAAPCVTISVGVVTGRVGQTHGRDEYVMRADEMLYASKQGGRDRITACALEE